MTAKQILEMREFPSAGEHWAGNVVPKQLTAQQFVRAFDKLNHLKPAPITWVRCNTEFVSATVSQSQKMAA